MYLIAHRGSRHIVRVGPSPAKSPPRLMDSCPLRNYGDILRSLVLFGPLAPRDHTRVRIVYRKFSRHPSFCTFPFI